MIEQIESAETKDELEALGKEHLDVDVDKRKGVETIRAELTELAEGLQVAGEPEPEKAEGGVVETVAPEAQEPKKKAKGRQLRHRGNGRVFPWTAALAKKREMQEV